MESYKTELTQALESGDIIDKALAIEKCPFNDNTLQIFIKFLQSEEDEKIRKMLADKILSYIKSERRWASFIACIVSSAITITLLTAATFIFS